MRRPSRSNAVISWLFVISAVLSLGACTKRAKTAEGRRQAELADPKYVAANQSLEGLKTDAQKLQAETAAIHKRLERLDAFADDLPGLAAFRSGLFGTEEILGGV